MKSHLPTDAWVWLCLALPWGRWGEAGGQCPRCARGQQGHQADAVMGGCQAGVVRQPPGSQATLCLRPHGACHSVQVHHPLHLKAEPACRKALISQTVFHYPGPGYVKDCLSLHISAQTLRWLNMGLLRILPLKEARLVGTRKKRPFLLWPPVLEFSAQKGLLSLQCAIFLEVAENRTVGWVGFWMWS